VSLDPNTAKPVESSALRDFAGRFATGVTVLTTRGKDGKTFGLTMNAVSCVCLEPPLFLACVDQKSATLAPLTESGVFALNILAAGQDAISNNFASKGDDKFANVATEEGVLGVPLITGALAAAEFRLHQTIESGDHVIVIGEALASRSEDVEPLLYFRGKYGAISR
jgi:flavin reductase (DIM6/NTAB) family NADH-FMN oxidoreductase RutF